MTFDIKYSKEKKHTQKKQNKTYKNANKNQCARDVIANRT